MTEKQTSKRKAMYKCGSPSWRETYKSRCKERLKGSRSKMLEKFRKLDPVCETEYLDNLMQQEWMRMKSEGFKTNQNENIEDVTATLDKIKSELLEWEAESLLQLEVDSVDADIAYHDRKSFDSNDVICPVCNLNYLNIRQGCLNCQCGLHINMEQDSLSITNVKASLEEGVSIHSGSCNLRPQFNVVCNFGTSNLLITCAVCDFMFIVV